MNGYSFLIFIFSIVSALCLIPNLSVKKLDKTLVARKRQDTMDMCKLFSEESHKGQQNNAPKLIKSYVSKDTKYKRDLKEEGLKEIRRYKRGATMKYDINPALNPVDAKRVENIVDKLYDDLEEKGQRVTYRQAQTTSSIKVINETYQPSRRFDFAPAEIIGPQAHLKEPVDPNDVPFNSKARWKRGIVPYFIDFRTYDTHLADVIVRAFDYVERATCIRLLKLREKPIDKLSIESVPWVYITNPTGIRQCVHSNENLRVNGVLMVVFGYDCMSLGDIIHETMHILGYSHEHLRSDRDQHVTILWENIKPGYKKYFDLTTRMGSEYDLENLPYDYSSILHYPPRAFSRNGKATILTERGVKIGQREGLSEMDVEKVAVIYANECIIRNREYLLQTCPSVVKSVTKPMNISHDVIAEYFSGRLWSFGIVNYKLRDKVEFTVEERENIKAVFRHIEQETCLQFRDVGSSDDEEVDDSEQLHHAKKTSEPPKSTTQANEHEWEDDTPETLYTPDQQYTTQEQYTAEQQYTTQQQYTLEQQDTLEPGSETPHHEDFDFGVQTGASPEPYVHETEENLYEINKKKNAEIIITNKKDALRQGAKDKKNIADNEIQKIDNEKLNNDILDPDGNKEINFKGMSLTMKRAILKKARAKRMNKISKRSRRDTKSMGPASKHDTESVRRHADAMLVLTRSPNLGCPCPEPGKPRGDQVLEIGAGCFNSVNDLLHFFVHVLGLDHQHNMHDRDNYLHVVWENLTKDIREEMEHKLPPAASVGFPYDYQSVMHYPWLQIKDGKTNIMYPIWNDGWAMGHWQGLSSVDVQKLNLLYFSQCMERQKQDKQ